jgi:hypothetical protein
VHDERLRPRAGSPYQSHQGINIDNKKGLAIHARSRGINIPAGYRDGSPARFACKDLRFGREWTIDGIIKLD